MRRTGWWVSGKVAKSKAAKRRLIRDLNRLYKLCTKKGTR